MRNDLNENNVSAAVALRDVLADDLPIFYRHQSDPDANYMAAFTTKDPGNRVAFDRHWNRFLADSTITIKTIICDRLVVGCVLSYEDADLPEVSYWVGKEYWGRGIATAALTSFLRQAMITRPICARVAKDNHASRRVLEKCGFTMIGESREFAYARGEEIDELLFELRTHESDIVQHLAMRR